MASDCPKSGDKYIKLNVGGYLYMSTVDTLTRGDTMLSAMFSGRMDVLRKGRFREYDLDTETDLLRRPPP